MGRATKPKTLDQSRFIESHDKRETLEIDFMQPGHPDRGDESELFRKSKRVLENAHVPPLIIPRSLGRRCYICANQYRQKQNSIQG